LKENMPIGGFHASPDRQDNQAAVGKILDYQRIGSHIHQN
jgi:hypothetical protein